MQGNPCKSEFLEKSKSKQKHTLQGAFLFSEQGFPCIGYNSFMLQLQGFPCFSNSFYLFWLHSFPVLLTFFSLFNLQGFPCFTKIQIYREFPVLVTTLLCYNYSVFSALITPFPCL
jgi:hypothetical protein